MEPEVVALLTSGATTVVGLMATDAWHQARESVTSLFSRSRPQDRAQIAADLDESREHILAARDADDLKVENDLQAELKSRLRRVVSANPEVIEELTYFVEQYGGESNESGSTRISIIGNAKDDATIFQQGHGVQHNKR